MNITLALKPIYYKLIDKGLKTIEYREITEYYTQKLTKDNKAPENGKVNFVDLDTVTFLSGSGHDRPAMKFKVEGLGLFPSKSHPTHYTIKLGERIKTKF